MFQQTELDSSQCTTMQLIVDFLVSNITIFTYYDRSKIPVNPLKPVIKLPKSLTKNNVIHKRVKHPSE
jgi:hypothetical protein